MLSQKIRRAFFDYFKENKHKHLPSAPVLPHNDPTLLFNNAGMNQFKDIFLGKQKASYPTAVTSQKCIRVGGKHNDLEQVGHTSRHLTFFEMLGNFSFGDYFKEQAIAFAWECSTKILKIDPELIWVTVYKDDDEAFKLWEKWVPAERICRFDEKENFWSMGEVGPCGPCSELHYDRGSAFGEAKNPHEDPSGERYIEFWNLVFMQYNRQLDGTLEPLPKPSIDTGMGLERLIALKMGAKTVFETDVLDALRREVAKIASKPFKTEEEAGPYNVIADHLRMLAFSIADGAQPGNVDRGYVLRKVLRRAVRYGRQLGLNEPFLGKLLPVLDKAMGEDYPELSRSLERIDEILTLEEENFLRTLKRGGSLLQDVLDEAKAKKQKISGADAFKLKDTYGFPIEEIQLIAHDENIEIDLEAYAKLEEEAKERSRASRGQVAELASANTYEKEPKTLFKGYEVEKCQAKVVALFKGSEKVSELKASEEGVVLLDQTPFYAEKGGQLGDRGSLSTESVLFDVQDTQSPFTDIVAHVGKVSKGSLQVGMMLDAAIDHQRRIQIQRHHSATHLLHWALQEVLGEHIGQAGSVVEPTRLRFDFNHHKALSKEEIRLIEDKVNTEVQKNTPVSIYELSYEQAQERSDVKQFFGDKYGKTVRVVDMDQAKELCGGTHVTSLGEIGAFKILREGSISSGVRRIEACVGEEAFVSFRSSEDMVEEVSKALKVKPHQLLDRVEELISERKKLEKELKALQKDEAKKIVADLKNKTESFGDYQALLSEVPFGGKELRELAKDLVNAIPVLLLLFKEGQNCQLLAAVSPKLHAKGISANDIIKVSAPFVEGRGGGKADFAQAGGQNASGSTKAIEAAREYLQQKS